MQLEEMAWSVVQVLLRDPERLVLAFNQEIERRRKELRGDPDGETRRLAERLSELDEERRGYQRLAARGSMTDDELDDALAGLEVQRKELSEALAHARNRQQSVERLRRDRDLVLAQFAQIRDIVLDFLRPEDRRRALQALRIRLEIDRNGDARISGMLNQDIGDLLPNDGTYLVSLDGRPDPPPFKGVVALGNTTWGRT